MGIKNDLQKKIRIFYVRKNTLKKNPTLLKNTKVEELDFFYIRIMDFSFAKCC
jgi:hypothetical protein